MSQVLTDVVSESGLSGEPPGKARVQIRGLSKIFGSTVALNQVDLDLRSGEIHALCGGNGSGKSTLIKILSGVVDGDRGTVLVGSTEVEAEQLNPRLSRELGIRVVHQDLGVFVDMTVAENMMIGSDVPTSRVGTIRTRQMRSEATEVINRYGIHAGPDDLLADLPVATRTQVAVARALRGSEGHPGVFIFDEATASLPKNEVKTLHNLILRLAQQGHVVVIVTHRLDEIFEIADRITILKDGVVTQTRPAQGLTERDLIEALLGEASHAQQSRDAGFGRDPGEGNLLTIADLCAGPLNGVNLEVRKGEIMGIAGLLGSGRTELLRAIAGDLPISRGNIRLNGTPTNFKRIADAIRSGVVLIPEDRLNGAVFPDHSVDQNLSVSVWNRYWRILGFRKKELRIDNTGLRTGHHIKAPDGHVPMNALSGGNQQKTIIARWLRRDPVLVLLDEPTQGVDVGAKAEIYAAVRRITDSGGAAVVVTSDLEEMAQVVDRAAILRDGKVAELLEGDAVSAHELSVLTISQGAASEIAPRTTHER